MTGNNGHAPKRFAETRSRFWKNRSKGFRGAAPDKQRAVFAAAETARKAKWVPLCPACHVCNNEFNFGFDIDFCRIVRYY